MTIDAIIAKITFDAVTKSKDYQTQSIETIDFLARHKVDYDNNFDNYLSSTIENYDKNIDSYLRKYNEIQEKGYGLFLRVIKLKEIENIISAEQNNGGYFLSHFLENNKEEKGIYTEVAHNFCLYEQKLKKFLKKSQSNFTQINADISNSISLIKNKDNIIDMIALSNINHYINMCDGKPIDLQKQVNSKICELNVSKERLKANDITFITKKAEDEARAEDDLIMTEHNGYLNVVNHQYRVEDNMRFNYKILFLDALKEELGEQYDPNCFDDSWSKFGEHDFVTLKFQETYNLGQIIENKEAEKKTDKEKKQEIRDIFYKDQEKRQR